MGQKGEGQEGEKSTEGRTKRGLSPQYTDLPLDGSLNT